MTDRDFQSLLAGVVKKSHAKRACLPDSDAILAERSKISFWKTQMSEIEKLMALRRRAVRGNYILAALEVQYTVLNAMVFLENKPKGFRRRFAAAERELRRLRRVLYTREYLKKISA